MRKWNRPYAAAIAFSVVLCLALCSLLGYIAWGPDFTKPSEEPDVAADETVWEKTFEDLIAFLDELGYIDSSSYDLISEGVATDARNYSDVELYWWDVDNLIEGSEEYANWVSMQEEGYMIIYGQFIFVPQMNGPFGMYVPEAVYAGDAEGLRNAFAAFPGEEESP